MCWRSTPIPPPAWQARWASPLSCAPACSPIAEMDDLIYERTGAKPGTIGGFFTLNPRVDDIPERFSVVYRGVRLLEMGSVDLGGSGCICPESAMLKTLFTHLLFRKDDVLILDMYAGVEHLGRATVDFVDAMLIVVEPTRRSLGTAAQIKKLANHIGLTRLWLVGNKVRNEDEAAFLAAETPGIPLLGACRLIWLCRRLTAWASRSMTMSPPCGRLPRKWQKRSMIKSKKSNLMVNPLISQIFANIEKLRICVPGRNSRIIELEVNYL